MKILGFYRSGEPEIEVLLDVRLRTSLHTAFGFFSLLDECQVLNEEDCSFLSMLYCESLQKHIFLVFCNDFESH